MGAGTAMGKKKRQKKYIQKKMQFHFDKECDGC